MVWALALLVAAGCGTPDAAPKPVTVPTITTSPQVRTSVPEINTISVQPSPTSEETVDATTEPPPVETTQPPAPVEPAPPVETTEPVQGPFVIQGAPCEDEGALGLTRRGKPMVCSGNGRGRLRWEPL